MVRKIKRMPMPKPRQATGTTGNSEKGDAMGNAARVDGEVSSTRVVVLRRMIADSVCVIQRTSRFWDLPTKLVEEICEILKVNNRKKSLATLNVVNKSLRKITNPYLWESVRWTPRTWKAEVYCKGKLPEVFTHVK